MNTAAQIDGEVIDNAVGYLMYPDRWHSPFADGIKAIAAIADVDDGTIVDKSSRGRVEVSSHRRGLRWELSDHLGEGFLEILQVFPGQLLTLYRFVLKKSLSNKVSNTQQLSFGVRAKGSGDFKNSLVFPDDNTSIVFWGGTASGYKNASYLPAGSLITGADITLPFLQGAVLPDMYDASLSDALTESQSELAEMDIMFSYYRSSTYAVRCLGEMIHCSYSGALKLDYMRAKTAELCCHIADLSKRSGEKEKRGYRASHRDVQALEKARKLLVNGYREKLHVDDIARDVGLSPNRFRNLFKQKYGEGVQEFLLDIRMAKARQLLTGTDLSIDSVSEQVGYGHASGFRQAFKKFYGVCPKQIRYE